MRGSSVAGALSMATCEKGTSRNGHLGERAVAVVDPDDHRRSRVAATAHHRQVDVVRPGVHRQVAQDQVVGGAPEERAELGVEVGEVEGVGRCRRTVVGHLDREDRRARGCRRGTGRRPGPNVIGPAEVTGGVPIVIPYSRVA